MATSRAIAIGHLPTDRLEIQAFGFTGVSEVSTVIVKVTFYA